MNKYMPCPCTPLWECDQDIKHASFPAVAPREVPRVVSASIRCKGALESLCLLWSVACNVQWAYKLKLVFLQQLYIIYFYKSLQLARLPSQCSEVNVKRASAVVNQKPDLQYIYKWLEVHQDMRRWNDPP